MCECMCLCMYDVLYVFMYVCMHVVTYFCFALCLPVYLSACKDASARSFHTKSRRYPHYLPLCCFFRGNVAMEETPLHTNSNGLFLKPDTHISFQSLGWECFCRIASAPLCVWGMKAGRSKTGFIKLVPNEPLEWVNWRDLPHAFIVQQIKGWSQSNFKVVR